MTKVSVAAAGDTAAASPHEFHPPDKYGACNALNFLMHVLTFTGNTTVR